MRGLLVKDLYCIGNYLRQVFLMIFLMLALAIGAKNVGLIGFYIVFMGISLLSSTMTEDEKCGWDRYALTFPVSRADMVKEKYVLLILLGCISEALGIVISIGLSFMLDVLPAEEGILSSMAVFFVYMFSFSVYVPVIYKFGAEKARYIFIGILLSIGVIAYCVLRFCSERVSVFLTGAAKIPFFFGALTVVCIVLFLSYRISYMIYEKKEF